MALAVCTPPSPEPARNSRAWRRRHVYVSLCWLPLLLVARSREAGAQGATLKRALPGAVGGTCPAAPARPATATEDQRRRARQLAARGQQAAIIDDYNSARDLYRQAAQLDPGDANTAYYLGRAQEAVKDTREAVKEYCRFLTLTVAAPEAAEVRDRIAALSSPRLTSVSEQALAQFRAGLDQYEKGRLPDAITSFSGTIAQAPDWPDPYYDRGIVYQAQDRRSPAVKDFEKYLQLKPEAEDRRAVVERIDALRRGMADPAGALTRGLIVPGFGQLYTRRPVLGALVLAGVGAAAYVATQQNQVRTTTMKTGTDPFGNKYQYPDVTVRTEYPYRTLGIAAVGGITILAALEAYLHARGERDDAPKPAAPTRTSSGGPAMTPIFAPSSSGVVFGMQLTLPRSR